NAVTLLSSLVIVGHYSGSEPVTGGIVKLMIGMFILQLMFLLIGTGIAAVSKKPKTAASAAAGILLLAFVLDKAVDLNKNLEILKYLTPFKYFEAKNLMSGRGFQPVFVILSVVIMAVLLSITYVFYQKKDLNV
ncbi:MAG: ABC transporter permease subunit, partial [Eubacteriales bacterium]